MDSDKEHVAPPVQFDMTPYTNAALRMAMRIEFQGKTAEEVFEVMGDPERIKDWYLLVKEVSLHPGGPGGKVDFDVEFTFFGKVHEEILHWDVPRRYVYKAVGDEFPIKDYVALIEIEPTGADSGVMHWLTYFDVIEGEHFQKILPAMLPAVNAASLERLALLIGGTRTHAESFM